MTIQQSAIVTKDNIFSQSFANIYNLINDRANVPDPNDSTGNRKFVHTREPLYLSLNFAGFPFVVVPDISYTQGEVRVSGTKAIQRQEYTITIMAQDKISDGSGDPFGRETVATISNNIIRTLNNITNRNTLKGYGMTNIKVDSSSFEPMIIDGKRTFRREMNVSFSGWGTIS